MRSSVMLVSVQKGLVTRFSIEPRQVGGTSADSRRLVSLCHSRHRGRVEIKFLCKIHSLLSATVTTMIQFLFAQLRSSAAVALPFSWSL